MVEPVTLSALSEQTPCACRFEDGGSNLFALLIALLILGSLALLAMRAYRIPAAETPREAGGLSTPAACTADARAVEAAVASFQASTGTYPTTLAELVPGYLRSPPDTARYTIALGTNAAPAATEPALPASGPSGAPAEWRLGRILVAPGPPPVGATSYRHFGATGNPPCDDPSLR